MPSARLPAIASAKATNCLASRACETGKLVASRSCCSSGETRTRSAMPRMSPAWSAWGVPLAFESRTVVGYSAPGWTKPTHRSAGTSSRTRRRAFSTPSTVLAWKARATPGALAFFWFLSWTSMMRLPSWSNSARSASTLPPSGRSQRVRPAGGAVCTRPGTSGCTPANADVVMPPISPDLVAIAVASAGNLARG